ncbi:NAD-dependent succinate-semialdehyde dehydrogenase [Pelagibacterium lacus]|uniref:NAD-dependent succinate-semialdehyde dehydrogenase n=1 Tax=Pelagibacterium lacus TaxID=2282655 RepID=A0A369W1M4_9HYPH|nr:NAD-dependent succinate-semialdehyde dehydrogenase [Pelagibacterium lacus]RDE07785.1 NAD-dependent succinate-semialdehyde dehydrogenase [Pelagibacterium lacus]
MFDGVKQILGPDAATSHVDGTWINTRSVGAVIHSPVDGSALYEVLHAEADDVERALEGASKALRVWRHTERSTRSGLLLAVYRAIKAHKETLASVVTAETGKVLQEALAEVDYAASYFRWYADLLLRSTESVKLIENASRRLTVERQPIGVCYLITPWNFPLAMVARKLSAALAAGCSSIIKPSESTPLSAIALVRLLTKAGAMKGLVNLLLVDDPTSLTRQLLDSRRIDKVSFTGSTRVGRAIVAASAESLPRLSLELGGNAPFVVLADADLDQAVSQAMVAKFRNAGQACTAANRFIVHRSVSERFTQGLLKRMKSLVVGNGFASTTTMGAIASKAAVDRLEGLIDAERRQDTEILRAETQLPNSGTYVDPAIAFRVPFSSRLFRDEIFGPIAAIAEFGDEEEAIELANDTEAGLAAYVFSRSPDSLRRIGGKIEAGMIGLNTGAISSAEVPFGGIKMSGYGREGGEAGLDDYLNFKATTEPS